MSWGWTSILGLIERVKQNSNPLQNAIDIIAFRHNESRFVHLHIRVNGNGQGLSEQSSNKYVLRE